MSNIQDSQYLKIPTRRCDKCGYEYKERKDDNGVTFFLCERCAKHYDEIVDYFNVMRMRIDKEEADALWDFLTGGVNEKGKVN